METIFHRTRSTMDINQLRTELNQLGVAPPDVLRSSIYLSDLQQAKTFFSRTLAGALPNGLGNDYSFVQAAVTSPTLLDQLAEILDYYLAPAVDKDIALVGLPNAATYQAYFDHRILDPQNQQYNNNVQNFLARFPITAAALQAVTQNFQQNILEMCRRVIQDRADIEKLFEDDFEILSLRGLKNIQSTGSDFHKGGKQVLILTFSTFHSQGDIPTLRDLNVVYKPSDLEADCLLIGNSEAVNRVRKNFMAKSLTEIINEEIWQKKQNNPNSTLEELPAYRILPCNYMSAQPGQYPLPVRNAYGYIEYLEYKTFQGYSLFNYYPFGSSDFLIFPKQNEDPIIKKFYRQMGQWLAIASTFSITDMHLENVRVKGYMPFLIDLEISLTKPANIATTGFFQSALGTLAGGINGLCLDNKEFVWEVIQNGLPYIDRKFKIKYYQNRLWAMKPTKRVVPVNAFWLLEGFANAMNILPAAVQASHFNAWFNRLNNVLVRVLPYDTTFFTQRRNAIFLDTPNGANYNSPLAPTIQTDIESALNQEFNDYQQRQTPTPNFVVLQTNIISSDYSNLDIPIFYHRIGTSDIVDSNGRLVPVPNTMNINNVQTNTNIGRNTFFQNPPTATNVQQGQVQIATNSGAFNQRVATLQGQVLQELGLHAPPNNPGTLIPTN